MSYEKSLKYYEEYIVNVLDELSILNDYGLEYYSNILKQNTTSQLASDRITFSLNSKSVENNFKLLLPDCYRIIDHIHSVLSKKDYFDNHKIYNPDIQALVVKANEHFETFKYIIANETYDKIQKNEDLKKTGELDKIIDKYLNRKEKLQSNLIDEYYNNKADNVPKKRLPNIF